MIRERTVPESGAQTRANRVKILQTIGYYGIFIALGLASAVLGPTLPGLAENTQTQLSEISFLFLTGSLGYLIGSLVGGRVFDRLPGHPVMVVDLLVIITMLVLIPLIDRLWLLILAVMIMGIAKSMLDVGGNTLLVWIHRERVGPFMNGLHFFFGLGAFLSPIIIAQTLQRSGGITWAYWILAILVVPIAVWLAPRPSPAAPRGEVVEIPEPAIGAMTSKGSRRLTNTGVLVLLIMAFYFLYVGAEISFGGWIFTYTVTLDLSAAAPAAYLTSAFWGALTVGRLLSIPIAVHFKPRVILLVDLIGCLIFAGVILLWPVSLLAVWVGAIGLGVSMASIFPTMISLAERRMEITGRVTGWFFVGASSGGMFLPWLIGQLFESVGPRAMIYAITIDLVVAIALFLFLSSFTRRSMAEPT